MSRGRSDLSHFLWQVLNLEKSPFTIRPTVHSNPSRKRNLSKKVFQLENIKNAGFAFNVKTSLRNNGAFRKRSSNRRKLKTRTLLFMSELARVASAGIRGAKKERERRTGVFGVLPARKLGREGGQNAEFFALSLLHENACYTGCVGTKNILITELFQNNDITIIKRFLCPSFNQTQIKLNGTCCVFKFLMTQTGQGKPKQTKVKPRQDKAGKANQVKASQNKLTNEDKHIRYLYCI